MPRLIWSRQALLDVQRLYRFIASKNTDAATPADLWSLENASAFSCWNDYIEKNSLPLEKHSSF